MPTIAASTDIDASIDEVFEFMATPENHLDVMPSLVDIRNVSELENGGHEGDFTFKMLGTHLDAHFEDTVFDPPDKRVYEYRGDVNGTITYDFHRGDDSTRLDVTHEFDSPGPGFVDRLTEPIVKRYLNREMNSLLENTTIVLEDLKAEA